MQFLFGGTALLLCEVSGDFLRYEARVMSSGLSSCVRELPAVLARGFADSLLEGV